MSERNWPIPFVLKGNGGWAQNYFVRSEADLDWPKIEAMVAEWRPQVHGRATREWPYELVKHRLLIEPYMTFFPAGGRGEFMPQSADGIVGSWWPWIVPPRPSRAPSSATVEGLSTT